MEAVKGIDREMSNENSSDNNSPSEKKTLSLGKNVGQGTVRQSFSHGRSKAVVVEKRKRRFTAPGDAKPAAGSKPAAGEAAPASTDKPAAPSGQTQGRGSDNRSSGGNGNNQGKGSGPRGQRQRNRNGQGNNGGNNATGQRNLTSSENAKRLQALEAAKVRAREMEQRKKEEEAQRKADAARKAEEDAKRKAEAEAAAAKKAEEDAVAAQKAEEERKAKEAAEKAEAKAAPAKSAEEAKKPQDKRPSKHERNKQTERTARDAKPGDDKRSVKPRGRREDEEDRSGARPGAKINRPQRGGARAAAADSFIAPDANAEGKPGAKTLKPVPKKPRPEDTSRTPAPAKPRGEDQRRRGKLTLTNALNADEQRERSLASMRRRRQKQKGHQQDSAREKVFREVVIPETITVQELAQRMTERAVDVIKILMKQGMMVKTVDVLDADTAQLVAEELGHTVKRVSAADVEEGLFDKNDAADDLQNRPAVVTIMGHVDHGKTSLLDAIRHANVVRGEAGGITQHIGAYQVEQNDQKITFIDTPGHAAFTEMRARGAKSTDIVILVVAADDGVMPQTIEAINHAKAADVPIIVAVNKIDLPAADPTRVRNELLQHGVFVESMGGEVLEVEVSAKEKLHLDDLLDAILMQSELLELKANPDRDADGIVVEAKLDKGRGPVATVLVQNGTPESG